MPLLGLTPALSQDLPAFISSGYKRSFPRLSNFFMVAFTACRMVQVPEDILCWVVGFIRNIYIYIYISSKNMAILELYENIKQYCMRNILYGMIVWGSILIL